MTLKQILFLTKRQASDPRGSCLPLYLEGQEAHATPQQLCGLLWYHPAEQREIIAAATTTRPPIWQPTSCSWAFQVSVTYPKCEYTHAQREPMHQDTKPSLTEGLSAGRIPAELGNSAGPHPDCNAQGCLILGFTQTRQEWAQAMVTVTLKAVTSPLLTGPKL